MTPGVAAGTSFYTGDVSGRVLALDASTGRVRWTAQPGSQTGAGVGVGDGVVVYLDANRFLVGLDARTGAKRWKITDPGVNAPVYRSTPALAGGVFALNSEYGQTGYSISTGKQEWTNHLTGDFTASTVGDGRRIFSATNPYDSSAVQVYGLKPTTGRTLWHARVSLAGTDADMINLDVVPGLLLVHLGGRAEAADTIYRIA